MRDSQPLISARKLSRAFGPVLALRDVDLDIYPGEFLTIFGPNGAGKTTLVKVLSTAIKPNTGTLTIQGVDAREEGKKVRREIGLITHRAMLYPNLTVRENLEFYGALYGLAQLQERIREVLDKAELSGLHNRTAKTLSHGTIQRVAIARALLHQPRILLMDEPFTGLDQHAAGALVRLLRALHTSERGIVMTTHDVARGLELCDRVAIQAGGRIVYEASAADINPSDFEELYFKYTTGAK